MSESWERSHLGCFSGRFVGRRDACAPCRGCTQLKTAISLVQRQYDEDLLLEACQEMGGTLFSLGEFAVALNNLERGFLLYDPEKYRSHAVLYGKTLGCPAYPAPRMLCGFWAIQIKLSPKAKRPWP